MIISTSQQLYGRNTALGGLVLSVATTNPSCDNRIQPNSSSRLGDGSIRASASGGTPPYTYSLKLITGPQLNGYFPGLSQGNYDVVVQDAAGETVTQSVYLSNTLPQPLMGTDILQVPSSCTSADGSLQLTPYGGTPPYTFSTDGGQLFHAGGTVLTNLQQGAYYTFVLKDANGCLAFSRTSGVNSGAHDMFLCNFCCALQIQALVDKLPCGNDGQLSVYASNANPPVAYSLEGINYQLGNGYNHYGNTFYNMAPGVYHIYARDAYGLETQGTFTLAKACANTFDYLSAEASCKQSDGVLTMAAGFGIPPYTYTLDGVNYQLGNVFAGLAAGSYNIGAKDALGALSSGIAVVTENCPALTATTTTQACGQHNGSITAQGVKGVLPYLFSIDGVHFQSSNVFTGLVSGNYTLSLKDAANNTTTVAVRVNSENCLEFSSVVVNTVCGNAGGSITVNASQGTAPYTFSKDGINFLPANVFSGLKAGAYSITVKDAGGFTAMQSINVADAPAPQITLATTPAGCSHTGGAITINGSGGTQPFQYSIDQGMHMQSSNAFTLLDSGLYQILVKDGNGCTVGQDVRLEALPTPAVYLGRDTVLCEGAILLLSAPAGAGFHYRWQDNSTGKEFSVLKTGKYAVQVTNPFNCMGADTINVLYRPVPVFSLGRDTCICPGQSLPLQTAVTGSSYLWSTGSQSPAIQVVAAGNYWLRVNNGGCMYADSIVVTEKPAPVVQLGPDTVLCIGQTLLLDATNSNAQYSWQDGSVLPLYTVQGPGRYRVRVTQDGCTASGQVAVEYTSTPVSKLVRDTTLCITEQLVLDAGFPAAHYLWQDGSAQPHFTVSRAGMYTVTVENKCGMSRDTVNVRYEQCDCHFYIPNAFTANHDGNNDVFRPVYSCLFGSYHMRLYNRFGQLLFSSADPRNGWNGSYRGQDQPAGGYTWMIDYVDRLTGRAYQQKGTVLLLR